MKSTTPLAALITCLVLSNASIHAAVSYWDTNGIAPGASDTPTGTWDVDAFWSADPAGASATAVWSDGDAAVFSAGTDATNAFTVTLNGSVNASGLTFEEGIPTLSGGSINMTNEFDFPIVANTDAIIFSALNGAFGTTGIRKTGSGKLTLSGGNSYMGTNTIVNGTVAITTGTGLGLNTGPTVVSNGATLQIATTLAQAETAILNGNGVGNVGAMRLTASNPGNNAWVGGALLGSDARINMDTSGTWGWATGYINGTNGGNNYNVTFGGTGSGTIRLNINGRAISIGTGAVYKDGNTELRFETPIICGAFYLNGGHVACRVSGGFMVASNNIYCGAGAGQFRTGSGGPSFSLPSAILLSPGSNPQFAPNATFSITCGGVISGPGGINKVQQGSLILSTNNTYTGNTTVTLGLLTLGANGSISNSPVIDVQAGASNNVSAVTGGFVLGPSQTYKGNGIIIGDVTAAGTISPGASVGTLSFSNNLTLAAGAKLSIEVDKSLVQSNDLISVLGTVTNVGAGTVTVANIGAPILIAGDSFQIFNQAVSNAQALVVSSAGGVVWTNKLAVDGSIAVLSAPPRVLTVTPVGPTSIMLGGQGGPSIAYKIYAYTNVVAPATDWWLLGTTNADSGGVIQFVDTEATNAYRFYRFAQ